MRPFCSTVVQENKSVTSYCRLPRLRRRHLLHRPPRRLSSSLSLFLFLALLSLSLGGQQTHYALALCPSARLLSCDEHDVAKANEKETPPDNNGRKKRQTLAVQPPRRPLFFTEHSTNVTDYTCENRRARAQLDPRTVLLAHDRETQTAGSFRCGNRATVAYTHRATPKRDPLHARTPTRPALR